ncbi:hypothetical protein Q7P37_000528 [Cladosporium fusiforme]
MLSRWCFLTLSAIGLSAALEKYDLQSLDSEYDYIIVGGGVSGLVVANRLSEDPEKTVLVVEYGEIPNTLNTSVPAFVLRKDQSERTWAFSSTPQTHLANRSAAVRVGSAVGGGSVINGMAYTRGSAVDYASWGALGNDGWSWDTLFPYFRKSTTFTPPAEEYVEQYGYEWTPDVYGEGPVQVGFASWQWPVAQLEAQAWTDDLSIRSVREGNNGSHTGLIWGAQTVSGVTGNRSTAATAYYQPVSNRTNLHLLVRHFGAKIEFEGNSTSVSGVKVASRDSKSDSRSIISSNVVLAAGAVNTPRLLQLSGIGPSNLLESLDIDVRVDAPGVGANFQDHPALYMSFSYENDTSIGQEVWQDQDFYDAAWEEYTTNHTGLFTFGLSSRIVFASLQDLNPDFESTAESLTSPSQLEKLPSIYTNNSTLLQGYRKQLEVLQTQFRDNEAAVVEIAFGGSGAVTLSLQKPLSRGTIAINSTNPDPSLPPLLDFNAGSNEIDIQIAISGVRKVREFMSAKSLKKLGPVELVPGVDFQTHEELEAVMRESLYGPSFAHPAGTAAMMSRSLGGVVDNELRVYGAEGLWVVDASIFPVLPAAHTQATVYAVAEFAADMIKQQHARN